jgi:hypothetical protein
MDHEAALADYTRFDPKDARADPRMAPHSMLTLHLDDDDPEGPTRKAEARVIAFFKQRTCA